MGWMNEWIDGSMDGSMDGWMDRHTYIGKAQGGFDVLLIPFPTRTNKQTQGIARERKAIVEGIRDSVEQFSESVEGTSAAGKDG
jgi:hypothetical protein